MSNQELLDILHSYYFVEDNWDSYGAPAPQKHMVDKAIELFNQFNIKPTDIDLDANDGIIFIWNDIYHLTLYHKQESLYHKQEYRYLFFERLGNELTSLKFYSVKDEDINKIKNIEAIIELALFK